MEKGNFNDVSPGTSQIPAGEAPIDFFWYLNCVSKAEEFGIPLQLVDPSDGIVAGLYTQFVTADAPPLNFPRLLLEMKFSDERQLAYAQGFTHPIHNIEILPDLAAKFPLQKRTQMYIYPNNSPC